MSIKTQRRQDGTATDLPVKRSAAKTALLWSYR